MAEDVLPPQKLRLSASTVADIQTSDDILKLVPERPIPEWIQNHKKSSAKLRAKAERDNGKYFLFYFF